MDMFLISIFAQVPDTLIQVVDTAVAVVPDPVVATPWVDLLMPLFAVVVAFLTVNAMNGIKWLSAFLSERLPTWLAKTIKVDGFPAAIQRMLVLVIAAGLTWLGNWLGIEIPTDLAMVGETDVSAVLMALGSMGLAVAFHSGDKKK